jgi:hypothetical protein
VASYRDGEEEAEHERGPEEHEGDEHGDLPDVMST